MTYEKKMNEIKILLLVLIGIPVIASTNIDCGGKSFHCVNSTHFMICVDLGGGISSTVDDLVISCPPPTLCLGKNRFECEFPVATTPMPRPQVSEVTNEISTTPQWEEIIVITKTPKNVSEHQLDMKYVDGTNPTIAVVTTDLPAQTTLQINTQNGTENSGVVTTESVNKSSVTEAKSVVDDVTNTNTNEIINNLANIKTKLNSTVTDAAAGSTKAVYINTTIVSETIYNLNASETNSTLGGNQTKLNNTETEIAVDFTTIDTNTIVVFEITDNPEAATNFVNTVNNVNSTENYVTLNPINETAMELKSIGNSTEDIILTTSKPELVTDLAVNTIDDTTTQGEIFTPPLMFDGVQTVTESIINVSENFTGLVNTTESLNGKKGSINESGMENTVTTTTEILIETSSNSASSNETGNESINNRVSVTNEAMNNNTINSKIGTNNAVTGTFGMTTVSTNTPDINDVKDPLTTEVIMIHTENFSNSTNNISEKTVGTTSKTINESSTLNKTSDKLDSVVVSTAAISTKKPDLVIETSTKKTGAIQTANENIFITTTGKMTNTEIVTLNSGTKAVVSNATEITTISGLPNSEIVPTFVSTTTLADTMRNESFMNSKPQNAHLNEATTKNSILITNENIITTESTIFQTGNTAIPQGLTSIRNFENNSTVQDNLTDSKINNPQQVSLNIHAAKGISSPTDSEISSINSQGQEHILTTNDPFNGLDNSQAQAETPSTNDSQNGSLNSQGQTVTSSTNSPQNGSVNSQTQAGTSSVKGPRGSLSQAQTGTLSKIDSQQGSPNSQAQTENSSTNSPQNETESNNTINSQIRTNKAVTEPISTTTVATNIPESNDVKDPSTTEVIMTNIEKNSSGIHNIPKTTTDITSKIINESSTLNNTSAKLDSGVVTAANTQNGTENIVVVTMESVNKSSVTEVKSVEDVTNTNEIINNLANNKTKFNSTVTNTAASPSKVVTNTTFISGTIYNLNASETNSMLGENQTKLNDTETKIADFTTIDTNTIVVIEITDNPEAVLNFVNTVNNVNNTENDVSLNQINETAMELKSIGNSTKDIILTTPKPDLVTDLAVNTIDDKITQGEIFTPPLMFDGVHTVRESIMNVSENFIEFVNTTEYLNSETGSINESGTENTATTTAETLIKTSSHSISSNNTGNVLVNNTVTPTNETESNDTLNSEIGTDKAVIEPVSTSTIASTTPTFNDVKDPSPTEVTMIKTEIFSSDTKNISETTVDTTSKIINESLNNTSDKLDSGVVSTAVHTQNGTENSLVVTSKSLNKTSLTEAKSVVDATNTNEIINNFANNKIKLDNTATENYVTLNQMNETAMELKSVGNSTEDIILATSKPDLVTVLAVNTVNDKTTQGEIFTPPLMFDGVQMATESIINVSENFTGFVNTAELLNNKMGSINGMENTVTTTTEILIETSSKSTSSNDTESVLVNSTVSVANETGSNKTINSKIGINIAVTEPVSTTIVATNTPEVNDLKDPSTNEVILTTTEKFSNSTNNILETTVDTTSKIMNESSKLNTTSEKVDSGGITTKTVNKSTVTETDSVVDVTNTNINEIINNLANNQTKLNSTVADAAASPSKAVTNTTYVSGTINNLKASETNSILGGNETKLNDTGTEIAVEFTTIDKNKIEGFEITDNSEAVLNFVNTINNVNNTENDITLSQINETAMELKSIGNSTKDIILITSKPDLVTDLAVNTIDDKTTQGEIFTPPFMFDGVQIVTESIIHVSENFTGFVNTTEYLNSKTGSINESGMENTATTTAETLIKTSSHSTSSNNTGNVLVNNTVTSTNETEINNTINSKIGTDKSVIEPVSTSTIATNTPEFNDVKDPSLTEVIVTNTENFISGTENISETTVNATSKIINESSTLNNTSDKLYSGVVSTAVHTQNGTENGLVVTSKSVNKTSLTEAKSVVDATNTNEIINNLANNQTKLNSTVADAAASPSKAVTNTTYVSGTINNLKASETNSILGGNETKLNDTETEIAVEFTTIDKNKIEGFEITDNPEAVLNFVNTINNVNNTENDITLSQINETAMELKSIGNSTKDIILITLKPDLVTELAVNTIDDKTTRGEIFTPPFMFDGVQIVTESIIHVSENFTGFVNTTEYLNSKTGSINESGMENTATTTAETLIKTSSHSTSSNNTGNVLVNNTVTSTNETEINNTINSKIGTDKSVIEPVSTSAIATNTPEFNDVKDPSLTEVIVTNTENFTSGTENISETTVNATSKIINESSTLNNTSDKLYSGVVSTAVHTQNGTENGLVVTSKSVNKTSLTEATSVVDATNTNEIINNFANNKTRLDNTATENYDTLNQMNETAMELKSIGNSTEDIILTTSKPDIVTVLAVNTTSKSVNKTSLTEATSVVDATNEIINNFANNKTRLDNTATENYDTLNQMNETAMELKSIGNSTEDIILTTSKPDIVTVLAVNTIDDKTIQGETFTPPLMFDGVQMVTESIINVSENFTGFVNTAELLNNKMASINETVMENTVTTTTEILIETSSQSTSSNDTENVLVNSTGTEANEIGSNNTINSKIGINKAITEPVSTTTVATNTPAVNDLKDPSTNDVIWKTTEKLSNSTNNISETTVDTTSEIINESLTLNNTSDKFGSGVVSTAAHTENGTENSVVVTTKSVNKTSVTEARSVVDATNTNEIINNFVNNKTQLNSIATDAVAGPSKAVTHTNMVSGTVYNLNASETYNTLGGNLTQLSHTDIEVAAEFTTIDANTIVVFETTDNPEVVTNFVNTVNNINKIENDLTLNQINETAMEFKSSGNSTKDIILTTSKPDLVTDLDVNTIDDKTIHGEISTPPLMFEGDQTVTESIINGSENFAQNNTVNSQTQAAILSVNGPQGSLNSQAQTGISSKSDLQEGSLDSQTQVQTSSTNDSQYGLLNNQVSTETSSANISQQGSPNSQAQTENSSTNSPQNGSVNSQIKEGTSSNNDLQEGSLDSQTQTETLSPNGPRQGSLNYKSQMETLSTNIAQQGSLNSQAQAGTLSTNSPQNSAVNSQAQAESSLTNGQQNSLGYSQSKAASSSTNDSENSSLNSQAHTEISTTNSAQNGAVNNQIPEVTLLMNDLQEGPLSSQTQAQTSPTNGSQYGLLNNQVWTKTSSANISQQGSLNSQAHTENSSTNSPQNGSVNSQIKEGTVTSSKNIPLNESVNSQTQAGTSSKSDSQQGSPNSQAQKENSSTNSPQIWLVNSQIQEGTLSNNDVQEGSLDSQTQVETSSTNVPQLGSLNYKVPMETSSSNIAQQGPLNSQAQAGTLSTNSPQNSSVNSQAQAESSLSNGQQNGLGNSQAKAGTSSINDSQHGSLNNQAYTENSSTNSPQNGTVHNQEGTSSKNNLQEGSLDSQTQAHTSSTNGSQSGLLNNQATTSTNIPQQNSLNSLAQAGNSLTNGPQNASPNSLQNGSPNSPIKAGTALVNGPRDSLQYQEKAETLNSQVQADASTIKVLQRGSLSSHAQTGTSSSNDLQNVTITGSQAQAETVSTYTLPKEIEKSQAKAGTQSTNDLQQSSLNSRAQTENSSTNRPQNGSVNRQSQEGTPSKNILKDESLDSQTQVETSSTNGLQLGSLNSNSQTGTSSPNITQHGSLNSHTKAETSSTNGLQQGSLNNQTPPEASSPNISQQDLLNKQTQTGTLSTNSPQTNSLVNSHAKADKSSMNDTEGSLNSIAQSATSLENGPQQGSLNSQAGIPSENGQQQGSLNSQVQVGILSVSDPINASAQTGSISKYSPMNKSVNIQAQTETSSTYGPQASQNNKAQIGTSTNAPQQLSLISQAQAGTLLKNSPQNDLVNGQTKTQSSLINSQQNGLVNSQNPTEGTLNAMLYEDSTITEKASNIVLSTTDNVHLAITIDYEKIAADIATSTVKPTASSVQPSTTTVKPTKNSKQVTTNKPNFTCNHHIRGRYSDPDDCRTFYICSGKQKPIIGLCPVNTVFSEIRMQCTKNLSHCIRNNKFKCVSEGRFSDYLLQNVYYICVQNRMHQFVRFKFQCQEGYILNKTNVRCLKIPEAINLSASIDSISKSTVEKKSIEEKKSKEGTKPKKRDEFECEKEGKFADENNCRIYYVCSKTNRSEEFRRRKKKCDSDEVFHKDKKKCVDAESYEC